MNPTTEIVGGVGAVLTITVFPKEGVEEHPSLIVDTLYVPALLTVIDGVVSPFDQRFPVAEEEVKVTSPPVHKVVVPLAVIVGLTGTAFTVTVVLIDVSEVQPRLVTATE